MILSKRSSIFFSVHKKKKAELNAYFPLQKKLFVEMYILDAGHKEWIHLQIAFRLLSMGIDLAVAFIFVFPKSF